MKSLQNKKIINKASYDKLCGVIPVQTYISEPSREMFLTIRNYPVWKYRVWSSNATWSMQSLFGTWLSIDLSPNTSPHTTTGHNRLVDISPLLSESRCKSHSSWLAGGFRTGSWTAALQLIHTHTLIKSRNVTLAYYPYKFTAIPWMNQKITHCKSDPIAYWVWLTMNWIGLWVIPTNTYYLPYIRHTKH